MLIRKEYRVESAHIVRNCTSERCSHSIHGHSAVIELFLKGNKLDNAGMLYDFGLMKGTIKEFIDSMDHCSLICKYDDPEYVKLVKKFSDRWIELPFNPSAEMLSVFIHIYAQKIMNYTQTNNGEGIIDVDGVSYHETVTGYARSCQDDIANFWEDKYWKEVKFSDGVLKDWSNDLKTILFKNDVIKNPVIKQQIEIK